MENKICKSLWIFCIILGVSYGYQRYQMRIPNGFSVPHPCGSGTWTAVGHVRANEGGRRNIFGQAFSMNGHNWTRICREDTDGDGMTNGEELGDPNCRWSEFSQINVGPARGHPAFCEENRRQCTSGSTLRSCPNRHAQQHPGHHPTPPPHAGKHPQALLTERLGQRPGGFDGGAPPNFDSFGGFQPSFDSRQIMGPPTMSSGFGQTPTAASPRFDSPGFGSSGGGGSFSGQQIDSFGPPRRSGSFSRGSSPRNWQSPPAGAIEPSRDTFSMALNQRFLQGDRSGGFDRRMPFRSPSPSFGFQQPRSSSLENQVQRRIQRERNSVGMRRAPFSSFDWRSSSGRGDMGPQFRPFYPETRSFGSGGDRFMF